MQQKSNGLREQWIAQDRATIDGVIHEGARPVKCFVAG
jgi:hypothetical protein